MKKSMLKQVSLPVRGKASQERHKEQKQPWFRRLQHFRAGVEGRLSLLQRKFGLKRSPMSGSHGTEIWVGQGIFAHNLWQAVRIREGVMHKGESVTLLAYPARRQRSFSGRTN